jgi:cell fate regulator YaaT (PSP1 superfamily)
MARAFKTRIELRQIGVRDEAKRLGGLGRCGRELCCRLWLPRVEPVTLQLAKDQGLSLNPAQISGACGRLMSCLHYEHEFYLQARKRFPKVGRTLSTGAGEEEVVAWDIFRDTVSLRDTEGNTRTVPLEDVKRETASARAKRGVGRRPGLRG